MQSPPINFVAPFQNVYYNMRALTSSLIQSRIIQKNLVYVIGLSLNLIKNESQLKSYEYFGQYGKIIKLVIDKNKAYNSNGPNGPCYRCFITYSSEAESSLAILSLDNCTIDKHEIKANYATTKYCSNFLKNAICKNKDCIFLHKLADEKDIVSRELMNTDKDIFPQQRLMAIELSKILTNKKYKELYKTRNVNTFFPNGFSVYTKELVIRYIKEKNMGVSLNLVSEELKIEKNVENKKEDDKKSINKINISENGKEKEEEKENIIVNTELITAKNENKNTHINNTKDLFKNYINFKNNLNSLFKSTSKSRFSFAKPDFEGHEINQIIPSQINDFITQHFMKHSTFFNEEQNRFSDYYFSLKPNSLDSDESWSSLVSTLKKWNDVYENGENETFNKFNTY
jgi:CCR4-NOT transcription complex subunit 4